MNALPTSITTRITMSSCEIATLTGKSHQDVLHVIHDMIATQSLATNLTPSTDKQHGQTPEVYALNKCEALVLIARLAPELTATIAEQWQTVEHANHVPQTYPEALRLAASLAEEKIAIAEKLQRASNKIAFADQVSQAGGEAIGNFAKAIGIGPNRLFAWLRDNNILMKSNDRRNLPRQKYLERKYFTVKQHARNTRQGVKIDFTTYITGKGQIWLTKRLSQAHILPKRDA